MVIVVPSTLTPPNTLFVAVGKTYVLAPDITPVLELMVIVVPSTLTPPNTLLVAVGNRKLLIVPVVILLAFKFVTLEPDPVIFVAVRVFVPLVQVNPEKLATLFIPSPINNCVDARVVVPIPPLNTERVPKVILSAFKFVNSLPEPIIEGVDVPPSPDVLPSPIQPCVIVPFILTLPKISKI